MIHALLPVAYAVCLVACNVWLVVVIAVYVYSYITCTYVTFCHIESHLIHLFSQLTKFVFLDILVFFFCHPASQEAIASLCDGMVKSIIFCSIVSEVPINYSRVESTIKTIYSNEPPPLRAANCMWPLCSGLDSCELTDIILTNELTAVQIVTFMQYRCMYVFLMILTWCH